MNVQEIRKAAELLDTVESCEKLLIEIGIGKFQQALGNISVTTLRRYIEAGLEFDLDIARAELGEMGVINECI